MKKLEIVIEKNDNLLWGRVEGSGWMPTPYGNTIDAVIENLKELVADYVANEGANDKVWSKIDWNKIEVEFQYDLQAFFMAFPFLNLSELAGVLGVNRTLLNHYKSGKKHASLKQAKKIEHAIHELASNLSKVQLVA